MSAWPNTGSQMSEGRTNSGLSTQIIIKINDVAVGALQNLSVSQNRPLVRVKEIGTDGTIEITPQGATEYELTAGRVVFDQLRLPEAFSRGFRFIAAQRIPFDIEIFDIGSVNPANADPTNQNGTIVMTYKNCWFTRYETPYTADNYLITETATIWAETAFISNLDKNVAIPNSGGKRGIAAETDAEGIEKGVNHGGRRGAMDASGVFNSIMKS
jgi:hypothetical protein